MSSDIFMMFSISFIIPLFLFLLMKYKILDMVTTSRLPPGPKKFPIIGNLHQLGKLPHRSLKNLSKIYGDLMFLQLGSVPTLVVSSADMAQEIFKTHDRIFSGRPPLYAAKKLTYNFRSIAFAPYGDLWRETRKVLVLELMTVKKVQSFEGIRDQVVTLMMDRIAQATNHIDLSAFALSLSNHVVCSVEFGRKGGVDGEKDGNTTKFHEILHETQNLLGEFNVADYFPKLAWVNKFNGRDKRIDKNFQDLDTLFEKVIEEHLDPKGPKSHHKDMVDVLLQLQKDPNQAITLKNEHIKAVLLDIFVAGSDTPAATITWTMAELMRNPIVREKAQKEVREIAKGKLLIEEIDIPKLTYLNLVIKESLRLHPPIPLLVPRETTQKCTIDNKYEILEKTKVFFNVVAIATDPKHWENPENFWPERFTNSEVDYRGNHFELLPFGAGRRGCPGINFAIPLVELALANLLLCFDWDLPEGISPHDLDMEEALGVTMHKKIPLCLVASPVKQVLGK